MQEKNSIVCNVGLKLLKNMAQIIGNHVHLGNSLKIGPRKSEIKENEICSIT